MNARTFAAGLAGVKEIQIAESRDQWFQVVTSAARAVGALSGVPYDTPAIHVGRRSHDFG